MSIKSTIRIAAGVVVGVGPLAFPAVVSAEDHEVESTVEIQAIVTEAKRMAEEFSHSFHDWKGGTPTKTTYMGIVIESVPDVLRDYIDLPDGVGLLLTQISKDGPAMKAGLVDNDILISFAGQIIINFNQLTTLIDMQGPGASVPLKVLRKGEEMEFTVLLEERLRKGSRFLVPDAPEPPEAPDVDDLGGIMERVEEWIPGSVQVFIDENQQVHVDLQDLKSNLENVRIKLLEIRESGALPVITEFGDYGARTSVVHVADRNINYNSKDGQLILNSSEEGQRVMIMDPEGNMIYQGELPDDYQTLPEPAIRLIEAFKASREMLEQKSGEEYEIHLTNEAIEPVTLVMNH